MRVLIADDQKNVGATLAHLVSECNHEVVEVVVERIDGVQRVGEQEQSAGEDRRRDGGDVRQRDGHDAADRHVGAIRPTPHANGGRGCA